MKDRITEDFAWVLYNFVSDWKMGKYGTVCLQEALDKEFEWNENSSSENNETENFFSEISTEKGRKRLVDGLIEELNKKTPEELDKEFESITHEKFWSRWVEKVEKLGSKERIRLISKICKKYNSSEYVNKEWSKGYEPRQELFSLLYEYATIYGENIFDESEQKGDNLDFCCGLYLVDKTYIVELLCGQGSVIKVFTEQEWTDRQKYLKSQYEHYK